MEFRPLKLIMLYISIAVFVIIAFKPFGFETATGIDFCLPLLVSVVGIIVGTLINYYLPPLLFRKFFASENWNVGKEIFNNILYIIVIGITTGLVHIMLSRFYYLQPTERLPQIFRFIFVSVLLVSPLPLFILALLNRNSVLFSNFQHVRELNEMIEAKSLQDESANFKEQLTLMGTTKDSVVLEPNHLLYVEAYGNYVKVNYSDKTGVKQKILRATIGKIEESLQNYPYLIRCHRAFIVNANNIIHIEGNSQGYRLSLRYTNEKVPVSRAYTKTLKEQIEHIPSL